MNNSETFDDETEHMDSIYDKVIEIQNTLTEIADELDTVDSEKLEEELKQNHIGWEGQTKTFWIKRIEEAIHALSFAQPY